MKKTITEELKSFYINKYLETYSVTEVMKQSECGVGRNRIVKILKEHGIYEGLSGPNYLKKKVKKMEEILLERYNVKNWGQTGEGGYKQMNKIPYKKISYLTDQYKEYRLLIHKKTEKNLKKLTPPKYCHYTGILFADEEYAPNPNDPRKRSVDHKLPIIICYLKGMSVEEASSIDNLIFVLKYVNSVKANMTEDSFIPIAEAIRKVFINEGYKSN
jgi:hypothetical protein